MSLGQHPAMGAGRWLCATSAIAWAGVAIAQTEHAVMGKAAVANAIVKACPGHFEIDRSKRREYVAAVAGSAANYPELHVRQEQSYAARFSTAERCEIAAAITACDKRATDFQIVKSAVLRRVMSRGACADGKFVARSTL